VQIWASHESEARPRAYTDGTYATLASSGIGLCLNVMRTAPIPSALRISARRSTAESMLHLFTRIFRMRT